MTTHKQRVNILPMFVDDLFLVPAAVQDEFVQFLSLVVILVHLVDRLRTDVR